ncbi:TPA: hypothetical protein R1728_001456, partial [Campylobacter lari]|nr:hypothetical protein [Campylobacter lari]
PFKANPVININALGQKIGKELSYDVKTYTPKIEYPSFKAQEKTIDYIDDFSIKVSGLLPNSTIDNISGSKGVKAKKESFNVNDNGEATLEFEGISDYSVKELTIKFSYIKQGSVKEELNLDKIKLYQYNLQIQSNRTWFYNKLDEQSEIKITGGRLNSEITWNIQGDGIIINKDSKFNSQGEAKATITSKAPFENEIIISASTLGKKIDQKISYKWEKFFLPKIMFPYGLLYPYEVYYVKHFPVTITHLKPGFIKVILPDGVKSEKDLSRLYTNGETTINLYVDDPHLRYFRIELECEYRESTSELKKFKSDDVKVLFPEVDLDRKEWRVGYNPMSLFSQFSLKFKDKDIKNSPDCRITSYELKKYMSRVSSGGIGFNFITFVNSDSAGHYDEGKINFSCFGGERNFEFTVQGI